MKNSIICLALVLGSACGSETKKETTEDISAETATTKNVAKAAETIIDEAAKEDPKPTVEALLASFYESAKDGFAEQGIKTWNIDEQRGLITFLMHDNSAYCMGHLPLTYKVHIMDAEIEPYDEELRPYKGIVTVQTYRNRPDCPSGKPSKDVLLKTKKEVALWGTRSKKFTWQE